MSSKRSAIASDMVSKCKEPKFNKRSWLHIIYAFEQAGYQVVKTSETLEYQGLRLAEDE